MRVEIMSGPAYLRISSYARERTQSNHADPDQTPHKAAFDQDLHYWHKTNEYF